MSEEKKEESAEIAAKRELAVKREMECRRRVEEILGPKKERADKLPFQSSYPRRNDQAPLGDRKLGERSTPNHTKRSFTETQNASQRSQLQSREKRQKWPQPQPRSLMSPPKPTPRPNAALSGRGTSATGGSAVSNPKPSLPVSDQATLNGQNHFCEVCKVDCSGPNNYKQHLSGKKHKAKLMSGQLSEAEAVQGCKKGDNKDQKCELCHIVCTDEASLQAHFNGRKHKVRMLDSRVLGQNNMAA